MTKKHMARSVPQRTLSESRRFNPLREFARFMDDMTPTLGTLFAPPVDIAETKNDYAISIDLPGVSKEDVHIQLRGNQLMISGERREEHENVDEDTQAITCERSYGAFQRAFVLPDDGNADQARAEFQEGVLMIRIPKSAQTQPRMINITEGRRKGEQVQMEAPSKKVA